MRLDAGWELQAGEPGDWVPAEVPGTVAGALAAAGRWEMGEPLEIDGREWSFRRRGMGPANAVEAGALLRFDGLATLAEVSLDDTVVLSTHNCFRASTVELPDRCLGDDEPELRVRILPLAPLLAASRRPRARWRTRAFAPSGLRHVRTRLVGRAPGFAPGPPVAGIWRPVHLLSRALPAVTELRAHLHDRTGALSLTVSASGGTSRASGGEAEVTLRCAGEERSHRVQVASTVVGWQVVADLRFPGIRPWWPHTHGDPVLYEVLLRHGPDEYPLGKVGFRSLVRRGETLCVNETPLFARGAVWMGDLLQPHTSRERAQRFLGAAVRCGMNIVRVPGSVGYESPEFRACCDELGLLIWQDLPFSNFDVPEGDPEFLAEVEMEVSEALGQMRGPSTAVISGGSEIEQQAAMTGVAERVSRGPLFGEMLPRLVAESGLEVPYVPGSPHGGEPPFRNDVGIAHYYGVGAYRRELTDARLSGVRFAAESLAFANVPDTPVSAPAGPAWKLGVPRDPGSDWDFDDVRDHYLALLYGDAAPGLRNGDPARYTKLSQAVTGEVMAAAFGEWRRPESVCSGAIVLALNDLLPGAGWGITDSSGRPKPAAGYLRRALAPVAIWTTDEGLNGVDIHVANDRGEPLRASVRVALYRNFQTQTDRSERAVEVAPFSAVSLGTEELLGGFRDVNWAYRFGPPAQDLLAASLVGEGGSVLMTAFSFPLGRPRYERAAEELGLEAERGSDGCLLLRTREYVHGLRISAGGGRSDEDCLGLEPGCERRIPIAWSGVPGEIRLSAVNLRGEVIV